jgi:hypothetical protein
MRLYLPLRFRNSLLLGIHMPPHPFFRNYLLLGFRCRRTCLIDIRLRFHIELNLLTLNAIVQLSNFFWPVLIVGDR